MPAETYRPIEEIARRAPKTWRRGDGVKFKKGNGLTEVRKLADSGKSHTETIASQLRFRFATGIISA
jgi:hypothetical protein